MKFKSMSSDLLVTIVTLVAALAAVTAAMAFQEEPPGFERYDQAYPEPYPYPLAYAYNTIRVSVASDGTQANDHSFRPSISADGRYVAFDSSASNLVAENMGQTHGIFIHDIHSRVTTRLSVTFDHPVLWPVLSSDARYVVFSVYPGAGDQVSDIYVHDRNTGQTSLVSVAHDGTKAVGYSASYSISDDGRYISFSSDADNLVVNDTNGNNDVFVRDLQNGEIARVSVGSEGTQANDDSYTSSISANGRYVAFFSNASNLVADDTNEHEDVFVHDRQSGETMRISVASDGTQAYTWSSHPSISADGRYVAFESFASNLVTGDTNQMRDIFVHDRQSGQTSRISIASDGTQANGSSYNPSISDDGRYVAFESRATNLAMGIELDWGLNTFTHDRQTGQTNLIPDGPQGFQPNAGSNTPSISGNGRTIAFNSYSRNLVTGDTNGVADIFVYDNTFSKISPTDDETNQSAGPTLSWQASASATSYEYCYSSVPGPCTKWNSVGTDTSVTLSGLAPGYTYYWQARGVNPGGVVEADDGTWWSFTTTAASACTWPAYAEPTSATFGDVPMDAGHWSWVERLSNATITAGCGAGNYCPFSEVNRAQMAIFLLRGRHCGSSYTPPAIGGSTGFGDVPLNATYTPWVKQLAVEGITAGCGGGNFCPLQVVNRAQMAIFLLRAKHGYTYSPPAVGATTGFGDVPLAATYAPWVKQLAAEGITVGCGDGNFCPLQNVNRAQMATFLVRVFGLP